MGMFGSRGGLRGVVPVVVNEEHPLSDQEADQAVLDGTARNTPAFIDLRRLASKANEDQSSDDINKS